MKRRAHRRVPPTSRRPLAAAYDPAAIEDAPEHYGYARSQGLLTWGTWDAGIRPVEERRRDFVTAFPPQEPLRYLRLGLRRGPKGRPLAASPEDLMARLLGKDTRAGSLSEFLARYGLKISSLPAYRPVSFEPAEMRETAQRRNIKLRALHGGVDIEPANMDRAKAEMLDRQEKVQAAKDVREALLRMRDDLARDT